MRFRNYINTNNRRNRIFSEDDIWNMKLSSLFDNEADIMAQNKSIGIPTMQELEQSPYTRKVEDDIIYGDNADAVATWEALLEEIAERIQAPPEGSYFDKKKKKKRRRDEEEDDEQNEKGNNNPMPEQTSEPAESTTESESGEEASEESQETSAEEDASEESSPVVLEGKVEENVDLGKDIPPAVQNPESVDKYENLFPLVYGKTDLPEGINRTVDAKPTLKQKFKESKLGKIIEKYEGLEPEVALQKAASKLPDVFTELDYYGIASKLADGDKQNKNVLEENSFYKIGDIKDENLRDLYIKKAAKIYDIDPNSPDAYNKLKDVDVVIPKIGSSLHTLVKNSPETQKWVIEHYKDLQNNKSLDGHIEFKPAIVNEDKRALFGAIHNAELNNVKLNTNGSTSAFVNDLHDYELMKMENPLEKENVKDFFKTLLKDAFVPVNNNAYQQQEAKKLKNYLLSDYVYYSKEELDKLRKKLGKKK